MNNPFTYSMSDSEPTDLSNADKPKYLLHLFLFLLTLLTTTLAGAELVSGKTDYFSWEGLLQIGIGLPYSLSFLTFLTVHEFGHYFTARLNQVRCSLPYFIPLYLPFSVFNIGSMGAIIRMRQTPNSTQQYFDIGIAGPLAGFVVALAILIWGFTNIPAVAYLQQIHPDYLTWFGNVMPTNEELTSILSQQGAVTIELGHSLIFEIFRWLFAQESTFPPDMELYHYPFLFVGYLTLFFTALNLLPIGQLDGGHVTYGLFGREWAGKISRITVFLLIAYGGIGWVHFSELNDIITTGLYLAFIIFIIKHLLNHPPIYITILSSLSLLSFQYLIQELTGWEATGIIWLVYSFIAVRLIKLDHPPAYIEQPLNFTRKILGIISLVIFILCFTPDPLKIVVMEPPANNETPEENKPKDEGITVQLSKPWKFIEQHTLASW